MIGLGFLISCLKPCLAGVVCGAAEVEADTPEVHQLVTPPLHIKVKWVLNECFSITCGCELKSCSREP